MNPDKEQFEILCNIVRAAAQQVSNDRKIKHFKSFPNGWCGCVSRVLGAFLSNIFPNQKFEYVCGDAPMVGSHAWIEYQNIIMDITADQFDGCKDSVIVKDRRESSFHQKFRVMFRHPCSDKDVQYEEESMIWKQLCETIDMEKG